MVAGKKESPVAETTEDSAHILPTKTKDVDSVMSVPERSPERIWHSREKGSKIPPNTVKVSRRSKWANPFAAKVKRGEDGQPTYTRQMFADEYRFWVTYPYHEHWDGSGEWVEAMFNGSTSYLGVPLSGRPTIAEIRAALGGKDLACDCDLSQPCHAEVLLELANGDA